jgi:carboxymethylenebutenolidase
MRGALHDAGKSNFKLELFPGAQHGFFADYRPSYNEKAAKQAWPELLAWMKENGVA